MPHGGTPPPLLPPRWVVSCRSCFKTFVHSYVGHARNVEDYLYPTEPVVPHEGVELECPKCKTKAVYHSTDLRYISR
jgi:ribosomal protein S27E